MKVTKNFARGKFNPKSAVLVVLYVLLGIKLQFNGNWEIGQILYKKNIGNK
jgi:hypothetical protein